MSAKRKNIGFIEWLGVAREHGGLLAPLVNMGVVMFAALMIVVAIPAIGWPLFLGLGVTFLWTLRYVWQRDCKNPPWWMKITEEQKDA